MKKGEKVEKVEIVDDSRWEEYITKYESLDDQAKKNFLEVFYQELHEAYVTQDYSDSLVFSTSAKKILSRIKQLNNLRDTLNSQDSKKVTELESFRLRKEEKLKARQDRITSLRESLGPDFNLELIKNSK